MTVKMDKAMMLGTKEQEPVGRFAKFSDGLWREVTEYSEGVMLFTSPPQRQPLTTKEIAATVLDHCYGAGSVNDDMIERAARAIEAKLKEKNT